ncbi:MAG: prepilin-type N-terminal cleavage/methylation domain-containing protein [Magnetococcales bacterium]|nr:prepilin-type N-terminal cleavage/methylation domain-containing protein [Magnetococcales bacterium]MBF0321501.1 prepilin-type N-terminal cleavage/methylation domain-containing protein [Magnetococcales bacterium]
MKHRTAAETRAKTWFHRSCGFSLVEMLLVILIMGIVSSLAAPLIGNYMEAYLQERDLNNVSTQDRLAMARMSRELRSATDITSDTVPFADQAQVQFTPQGGGSTVTYVVNGDNQLVRTQAGVSAVLADHVASIGFTSNNDAPPVRLVDITLTIMRQHVNGGSVVFSTSINPRNSP